ncbi:MAG: hypothetical protein ACE5L6_01510 [Candidatus Bathyarchaeia archaeon]
MTKWDKREIERLLLTTSAEILIALLDGELQCGELAERVGITPQHLSRLLPALRRNQLIFSKFPDRKRINRLTSKGKSIALLALRMKSFFDMELPAKEVRENELWVGRYGKRRW